MEEAGIEYSGGCRKMKSKNIVKVTMWQGMARWRFNELLDTIDRHFIAIYT